MAQLNSLIVTGDSRFLNVIKGTIENSEKVGGHDTPTSGDATTDQIVLGNDTRLTNSRTPTSHTHGNITNDGQITSTAVTPANTDYLLMSDGSNSGKIERGVAIGTSTTTFLRNDGTWATPAGTDTWRNIQLNGTQILGTGTDTGALNLADGKGVALSNSSGTVTVDNSAGIYYVMGTQTASTASWTGSIPIPALYDGLTINYYLPYAGVSSTDVTLNLTLSDGTDTGDVNVYITTSRLTTQYSAGRVIQMTYFSAGSISISGTPTTDDRWVCDAYYDTDANDISTIRPTYGRPTAGVNGLKQYSLFARTPNGKYTSFTTNAGTGAKTFDTTSYFDIRKIFYFTGSSGLAADALITANTMSFSGNRVNMRYSFTGVSTSAASSSLAANLPVYLVADPASENNGCYRLKSPYYTQSPNDTSAIYVLLGYMEDSYRLAFWIDNPLFLYDGTNLNPYEQTSLDTKVNRSGDTMTGDLMFQGYGTDLAGIKITNSKTNMDLGWDWDGGAGSGAFFRHKLFNGQAGTFGLYARKDTTRSYELKGTADGALTWGYGTSTNNRRVVCATNGSAVGGTSTPTYVDSSGVVQECSYTIAKNVPNNAVFTDQYVNQAANADANVAYQLLFEDTANSGNVISGTRKTSYLAYNPSTSTFTIGDKTPTGGTVSVTNLSVTNINGYALPAVPKFSDQAVQQLEGGGNADYEIIFEDTSGSGEITSGARKSSNLTFNPSTGKLTVSGQVDCSSISVSTPTYTMTKSSGAWNVGSVTARKSGNIVQMQVFVKGTGTAVTNGGSGFVGKITGTYLPAIPTTLVSYISSVIIVCYIDASGNIDVRPYGNTYTAASGTTIEIDGMFICP